MTTENDAEVNRDRGKNTQSYMVHRVHCTVESDIIPLSQFALECKHY